MFLPVAFIDAVVELVFSQYGFGSTKGRVFTDTICVSRNSVIRWWMMAPWVYGTPKPLVGSHVSLTNRGGTRSRPTRSPIQQGPLFKNQKSSHNKYHDVKANFFPLRLALSSARLVMRNDFNHDSDQQWQHRSGHSGCELRTHKGSVLADFFL